MIRFTAGLERPAAPKSASWRFLVLPKAASAKLPTRSATTVAGTINGAPFRAALAPDGKGSHWLKVTKVMQERAAARVGDVLRLEIAPSADPVEARVPTTLRKALAAAPKARKLWSEITPAARRDWIDWIQSAKQEETRTRRVKSACDMLASGKRRVCCFDRSGIYGGNFCAPEARAFKQGR